MNGETFLTMLEKDLSDDAPPSNCVNNLAVIQCDVKEIIFLFAFCKFFSYFFADDTWLKNLLTIQSSMNWNICNSLIMNDEVV